MENWYKEEKNLTAYVTPAASGNILKLYEEVACSSK